MAGHLLCRTCRLTFHLGHIAEDDHGQPIGFAHGRFTPPELHAVISAFLATHMDHDIAMLGESVYDMPDLNTYMMILRAGDHTERVGRSMHQSLGGVPVILVPTDSSANNS